MRRDCTIMMVMCTAVFASSLNAQQVPFKTYTVNDGLVANPVRKIFQDSKGFLWIATLEGISKYDGHKFTNYTTVNGLSHNLVNDFYELDDGKIYLAGNNGTTSIIENGLVIRNDLFPGRVINRFYKTKDQRVIALSDSSGIYELKAGQLHKINFIYPKQTFNEIIEFNDSLIALCSPNVPLIVLNSSYELVAEIKEPIPATLSIFPDVNDKLWLGTSNGLKNVRVTNNKLEFSFPKFHTGHNFFKMPVTCILRESDGNIWLGTTQGLLKVKPNGHWQHFTVKDNLPSNWISCLFQDKEKNIWIGTSMGLGKLVTKNKIELYTIQHGLATGIHYFFNQPDNTILVYGHDKIQQFDPDKLSFKTLANIKYPGYYAVGSKDLPMLNWNDKLYIYDSESRSFIEKFKTRKGIGLYCTIISGDRTIIGTDSGLIIGSPGKVVEDLSVPHRITDLLLDKKGYLWISTWRNGLFRVKADLLPTSDAANYQAFFPGSELRSLLEDKDGSIWAGSRYSGVFQVQQTPGGFRTNQFDHQKGLTSNWVVTIAEDAAGNIWLGSVLGLDKLIKKEKDYEVFNFSRINDQFQNTYQIGFSKDNRLWCLAAESLVRITDDRTEALPALPVYITDVSLGTKRFNDIDTRKKPSLKYYQNHANFEFTAAGYINEKRVMYSYRLLGGGDSSWSIPGNIHSVSYASLQPGNYSFQVRTVGWNGKYGNLASFRFNITPPFWKTWWFVSLIALVILLSLYALYRYRIHQLMQLQRVRNRLATDLHDDIGSTLTNINILSELSKKNLQEPAQASQFLQRITEEVTASGQALDDIIWSVNARNDSMEEIIARMRRYAADLFDSSDISYQLDLEEAVAGKKLKMEQRRDVYLIYKESLNNIYKHADAGKVWIKAAISHRSFELMIRDNGKGFNIVQPTHRNGLKNLHERVKKWNGKLSIQSESGKGTTIVISMPVGT